MFRTLIRLTLALYTLLWWTARSTQFSRNFFSRVPTRPIVSADAPTQNRSTVSDESDHLFTHSGERFLLVGARRIAHTYTLYTAMLVCTDRRWSGSEIFFTRATASKGQDQKPAKASLAVAIQFRQVAVCTYTPCCHCEKPAVISWMPAPPRAVI